MIDRSTAGVVAEPDEVEAVLHNLCGYHLAEQDPLYRYSVLTREQALYGALVAAIKRERGRALAELVAGRTLTQVGQMTGLGSRQRVQRLIAIAKAADEAAAAVQAASIEFERQLALATAEPAGSGPGGSPPVPVVAGLAQAGAAPGSWPNEVTEGSLAVGAAQASWDSGPLAVDGAIGESRSLPAVPPVSAGGSLRPVDPTDHEVAAASEQEVVGVLGPTLLMPALTAVLEPTKELAPAKDRLPTDDEDIAWWRHEVDTGAA